MGNLGEVMLASAGGIVVLMLVVWGISVAIKDASIVDIAWGFGFVVVAWVAFAAGDSTGPRTLLVPILASAWGLRLTLHLANRNLGKGEDFRYQAMRKAHSRNFALWSLVSVYGLQGALMFLVSLPLQAVQAGDARQELGLIDALGILLFAGGLVFEAIGDWQLAQFKANPANKGLVMDRGLWRYSRHPNYFGDAMLWWGLFCFAAGRPEYLWTVVSPLAMSFLLTRVSGVPLLEKSMARRKPGYAEYMQRTSGFFPLPPKRAAGQ